MAPPQARAILPAALRAFYERARANTYAAGLRPVAHPLIPGSKELRYDEPPYFYHDRYFDDPARPGNFFGLEVVSQGGYDGPAIAACSYGGGLMADLAGGEEAVYKLLQRVLREQAARVRFGERVSVEQPTAAGLWRYEDTGEVTAWGWTGVERIWRDGELLYSLVYQGGCLLAGY